MCVGLVFRVGERNIIKLFHLNIELPRLECRLLRIRACIRPFYCNYNCSFASGPLTIGENIIRKELRCQYLTCRGLWRNDESFAAAIFRLLTKSETIILSLVLKS